LGSLDLNPQTSNYVSLGGEYNHKGLSVTVTAYYNKVKDMIALVTIPNYKAPAEYIAQYDPVRTRQYQNIEDARTMGIDVNVRYTWKELAFGAGYSYLDTEANQYDTNHDRMHEVIIDGMAHHKGNVSVTWGHEIKGGKREVENEKKMPQRVGLGLYGRMSSKRYYQIDGDGKGYQLWRVTGSYEFKIQNSKFRSSGTLFRVEAGVDNIFNYVDRTPHGLHLGTTTPGTTVYASLTIRFNQGKKITNPINKPSKNINQDEQD
jgi:outer membrane receptor for ferrienterochelin and colicins